MCVGVVRADACMPSEVGTYALLNILRIHVWMHEKCNEKCNKNVINTCGRMGILYCILSLQMVINSPAVRNDSTDPLSVFSLHLSSPPVCWPLAVSRKIFGVNTRQAPHAPQSTPHTIALPRVACLLIILRLGETYSTVAGNISFPLQVEYLECICEPTDP